MELIVIIGVISLAITMFEVIVTLNDLRNLKQLKDGSYDSCSVRAVMGSSGILVLSVILAIITWAAVFIELTKANYELQKEQTKVEEVISL
jgi:TfoX/Sxy family transcriptional regulator of competence genes